MYAYLKKKNKRTEQCNYFVKAEGKKRDYFYTLTVKNIL